MTRASEGHAREQETKRASLRLPAPPSAAGMSLAEALMRRRSHREFTGQPVSTAQIAQLCWAAQGVTDHDNGYRTAPSAGAAFPIHLFVIGGDGVREYEPTEHALRGTGSADVRTRLRRAALDQACVEEAPICMVVSLEIGRTAPKYGARAERYCLLEAGHVAQNVLLAATAMGLGGVPVGAFDDDAVAAALDLPPSQRPVYLLPLGHPRAPS